MVKYLVDLPAETKVIVAKKQFLLNETGLMRVPVSQLEVYVEPNVAEDAKAEKRVIELPADSIAWLERMKSNLETIDVYDLFNNVLADNSRSYVSYQLNFNSETDALNTLAEWLLGHVEFVPKKEPKFYVIIPHFDRDVRYMLPDTEYVDFATKNRAGKFTEEEANELVEGLTALNARKVKVDE